MIRDELKKKLFKLISLFFDFLDKDLTKNKVLNYILVAVALLIGYWSNFGFFTNMIFAGAIWIILNPLNRDELMQLTFCSLVGTIVALVLDNYNLAQKGATIFYFLLVASIITILWQSRKNLKS